MANNKSRYTFIEFIQNYSIRIPLIQRDYVQGREYTDEKTLEKRRLTARKAVELFGEKA